MLELPLRHHRRDRVLQTRMGAVVTIQVCYTRSRPRNILCPQ